METIYLFCAVVGGTVIVLQFLMTLLGLGGHHDVGGDHDMGGHDVGGHDVSDHDTSEHQASHEGTFTFFSLLTFRTLTAAVAFFGLTGLACIRLEVDPWLSLAIAIGVGGLALVIVAWLMRLLFRLNVDGTIRIERAVGSHGTVYLSIPGSKAGVGKVHVDFLTRTVEYKAITSQEQLPTGSKIVVVGIVNADTVEVVSPSA